MHFHIGHVGLAAFLEPSDSLQIVLFLPGAGPNFKQSSMQGVEAALTVTYLTFDGGSPLFKDHGAPRFLEDQSLAP